MQSLSKDILLDLLELVVEKSTLVIMRNRQITSADDFLLSPERMEKFDAACMLIQVVGETAKKINDRTSGRLFNQYPQVYWRGVFGCRDIISHEYGNVDPDQIFGIIKKYLPELVECIRQIVADVKAGKHDDLFLA